MAHTPGRLSPSGYPHILNPVNYRDTGDLYTSSVGSFSNGGASSGRRRNGIAVTVTIPPTLRAFRYQNLTAANRGTPYASNHTRQTVADREEWFKATKANSANVDKVITTLTREIQKLNQQLKAAEKAKQPARVAKLKAAIAARRARIAKLRVDSTSNVSSTYSTEFEITDFITSLSWSSGADNSFIDVSISLDNIQGLFNHLPEAAKVTIWRRKSVQNINGLYGGKWYRHITCYVKTKSRNAGGRNHTMEITCGDRLSFAASQHYTKKKKWVKDKAHKNGWTPREITLQVCKAAGIPVDEKYIPNSLVYKKVTTTTLANGKKAKIVTPVRVNLPRIEYDTQNNTELHKVLSLAWKDSIAKLPRNQRLPFSMHMRSGSLRVEFISAPGDPQTQITEDQPLQPGRTRLVPMFNDKENIESISLEESIEPDTVYTVLETRGTITYKEKNKKTGKIVNKKKVVKGTFTPSGGRGDAILKAYGRRVAVRPQMFAKNKFKSEKEFRTAAQARIDMMSRPVRKLSLEGRANLGIWPITYVWLSSRAVGVIGNVMVESVSYNIQDGLIKVALQLNADQKHFNNAERFFNKNPPFTKEVWY